MEPYFFMPWGVDAISKYDVQHIQMHATQLSCCHGCDVVSKYDFDHMQMYAIQLAYYHGGVLNA
jgi:hypothetical protein